MIVRKLDGISRRALISALATAPIAPASGFRGDGGGEAEERGANPRTKGVAWKRIDAYAGVLWSQVTWGLASGYLYHIILAPTAGLRVEF
jgi:hypothetical protein